MEVRTFLSTDMMFAHTPASDSLNLEIPPLTFDRVYSRHITTSDFSLFKLPVEISSRVLDYLTKKDLTTLSLVDHDCLRLAMPSNFKDVKLCFDPAKPQSLLANHLFSITEQYAPSHPSLDMPSCIRRLTITTDPLAQCPPCRSARVTEHISPSENQDIHLISFIQSVSNILEKSLPNLHILDWNLPTSISSPTLQSIFASPAKHLRLEGVVLHEHNGFCLDNDQLPLETLSLNVSFTSYSDKSPHFFDNIFRRTRSTLRQLRWTGNLDAEQIYLADEGISFPCLRSLTLDTISCNSDNILDLFLGPGTRVETLAMDTMTPSTSTFFGTRGYMSTLKHLCWLIHDQGEFAPLDKILLFIADNSQLETLHIPGPLSPSFLSRSLLPTLTQCFTSLTSLHLVWASADIQEEALEAIATMNSLRHLWLSAGNQDGLRSTWQINHQCIITLLAPLTRLATLAFSRDTYVENAHPLAPRSCDYYSSRMLPVGVDVSKYLSTDDYATYQGKNVDIDKARAQQTAMLRLAWESWHAEQMIDIGRQYAIAFPSLHWFFVGQLAFASASHGFDFAQYPPRRDPCLTSLQKKMSVTLWRPI
ncbi:hypothetical protein HYPSUDRAFT_977224 [Hypholoma sublateritium FD-334 SS-4]|uniref:F-box domain-containing protein n=1 Tax=Hypholoma sublateritium (strain FD-334 SS-4) TaxID=945553 RepID=A0A0D2KTJ0_HYPSF|nr:hypothetical protein HYPSUDRAFT_977224 [Hypholoma sublateritium FD-334 SS-4]